MARKPDHLVPPCGISKAARIAWLKTFTQRGGRSYECGRSNGVWWFCWNVKLYNLDMSFENLKFRGQAAGYDKDYGEVDKERLREVYDEQDQQVFYEWAVTDARRDFVDNSTHSNGAPGCCAYTTLWSGDDVEARYSFMGSGGGWLVMTHLLDLTLDGDLDFEDLSYRQIRALAEMVNYVDVELGTQLNACRRVEECAAWILYSTCHE